VEVDLFLFLLMDESIEKDPLFDVLLDKEGRTIALSSVLDDKLVCGHLLEALEAQRLRLARAMVSVDALALGKRADVEALRSLLFDIDMISTGLAKSVFWSTDGVRRQVTVPRNRIICEQLVQHMLYDYGFGDGSAGVPLCSIERICDLAGFAESAEKLISRHGGRDVYRGYPQLARPWPKGVRIEGDKTGALYAGWGLEPLVAETERVDELAVEVVEEAFGRRFYGHDREQVKLHRRIRASFSQIDEVPDLSVCHPETAKLIRRLCTGRSQKWATIWPRGLGSGAAWAEDLGKGGS